MGIPHRFGGACCGNRVPCALCAPPVFHGGAHYRRAHLLSSGISRWCRVHDGQFRHHAFRHVRPAAVLPERHVAGGGGDRRGHAARRHRERAREHDLRPHLRSDRRAWAGDLRVWAVHRGCYSASLRHAGIFACLRRCLPCGHDARRAARDVSLPDPRALFAAARAFSRWLHGA